MSDDHNAHSEHDGGHELENMNVAVLFKLLIGLGLVVVISCVAVLQWVYAQQRELAAEHGAEGSYLLHEYEAEMDEAKKGLGKTAAKMSKSSADLKAFPPNDNFIDPDAPAAAR